MTWLLWLLGALAALAVASSLALYSYGRFARNARGADSHALPRDADATEIDRQLAPLTGQHPGCSGLALSCEGRGAFALRLASIRAAGRSLDIVTYIWRDDMSGRLLAQELMAAADRGVRVRLLLDDVNVQGFDPKFRALNGHPGIEVRLFNPVRYRGNAIRRGIEMLLMAVRFNRRMHAKLWIADGRLVVTGGRNVGNDYFDVPDMRRRMVRDTDLVMLGPIVGDAERQFDAYWNSGEALPIAAFWRDYEAGLDRFRHRLEENAALDSARALMAEAEGGPLVPDGLVWTDRAELVADPPEKAMARAQDRWLPRRILPLLGEAQRELRMITPYFVPGWEGMEQLLDLAERSVRVELLTNSLSATNHTVVHGAYRRYRWPLLAGGVRIYEFAPGVGGGQGPLRAEMLHSKGFTVDGRVGFIGTFNFDLRSAFLNIELGVVFEHPDLVAAFDAEFARCADPAQSYALDLLGRRIGWSLGGHLHSQEPQAGALRRGMSWVIGHLPIHSQL